MTKDAYPALFHYIHRAMADVEFPIEKEALLRQTGDRPVHADWNKTLPLRTFIEPINSDCFSCAADFYCRLIAAL